MIGPGEIEGPTSASAVVTPISIINQPLARSTGSLIGLRASSHRSKASNEPTKKYAPQPNSRNRPSAAYAPERPQAFLSLASAAGVDCPNELSGTRPSAR